MQQLLDAHKITHGQFEAALRIVGAFKFITGVVGFKPLDLGRVGQSHGQIGDAGERTFAIYVRWGNSVQRSPAQGGLMVRPHVIVEMIEDDRIIHLGMVRTLCIACARWQKYASEYDDAMAAKQAPERHTIMIAGAEPGLTL